MCTRHWFMVPVTVRRTINERFRACRADFAFLSDLTYLQACITAIEGVAQAEGHQGPVVGSSYHRLLRIAQKRQPHSDSK